MNEPIIYKEKTIVSASTIEQTTYEKPIVHGFEIEAKWRERRKIRRAQIKANLTHQELIIKRIHNRKLSMRRAKKNIIRIIDSNVYQYKNTKGRQYPPIFVTLTFKKDIRDHAQANELFNLFIKRLNYQINKKNNNPLRYTVVVEFQDKSRNGVIHYHALFYDLPFINADKLEAIWGEGTINIKSVKDIKRISSYVSKYMSKNFEDARLDGHKRYFSSRGLLKPKVYAGNFAYNLVRNVIPKDTPKKENIFTTEKLGKVTQVIYVLKSRSTLEDFLEPESLDELDRYDIS